MRSFLQRVSFILVLPAILCATRSPQQKPHEPVARQPDASLGKDTFLHYCASCHGRQGHGDGPAAIAMKAPPPDLTTLTKRHDGKFPAGYVGAVVKFGRSLAVHGSQDMPVWGTRFRTLDPVKDPTGQDHVDAVVAYISSLQVK